MQKLIPYAKLSKQKKRGLDRKRRGTWGTFNPATRKPPPFRAYRRERMKALLQKERAEI